MENKRENSLNFWREMMKQPFVGMENHLKKRKHFPLHGKL